MAVQHQLPRLEIQIRGGVVRGGPGVAALGAAVGADVVVVDVVILHGGVAHGAVGTVVVDPGGGVRVRGAAVQAEPLYLLMAHGKTAGQGIVAVQNQLCVRVNGRKNGVKYAFRVAVPGQLIPIQIGDDELRGVEVLEAVGGVPLVAFQQQHVGVDFAAKGGVGQDQGGNALHLVGALGVVDHVFPLGAQHRGDHLHGGCFAVGAGDSDDVGRQLYPLQNVGADFQGKLAGHGAALAHELAHEAAQLTDHDG